MWGGAMQWEAWEVIMWPVLANVRPKKTHGEWTDTQTHGQTDIATLWLTRPRGPRQWKQAAPLGCWWNHGGIFDKTLIIFLPYLINLYKLTGVKVLLYFLLLIVCKNLGETNSQFHYLHLSLILGKKRSWLSSYIYLLHTETSFVVLSLSESKKNIMVNKIKLNFIDIFLIFLSYHQQLLCIQTKSSWDWS